MNSAMRKKKENDFLLEFLGCECPSDEASVQDYKDAISEEQNMLHYSMDIGNKEEIKFWRSQITKTRMELKEYLEENKSKEILTI